ncbi:MAG: hypothetical protein A2900_02860 [Candidatus Chisholmbacteria bacterium RIFCSPLOWO2_01_FULL_50_28]|uniref:Uncharacterized protein n=1 Tax=Candidatus Chisholmbacteria bacterium RIFCSPHIGHO2_01_FULL_52_32 TaxID=1797591 RepID=A0A1G1VT76_9BACT|nr:MAG: hypothetical protein A2786_03885 [Candidatus Chisholmbacteria bacterium RIFCSPHIGHO2_01_FULL_52_32]OGY20018.1 MAG: hypothetical protein A2900_02860 [Candidatus Chisholmbacteria bacterium RIFCSPLOWO2_01_FULL_50_28]
MIRFDFFKLGLDLIFPTYVYKDAVDSMCYAFGTLQLIFFLLAANGNKEGTAPESIPVLF